MTICFVFKDNGVTDKLMTVAVRIDNTPSQMCQMVSTHPVNVVDIRIL